MEINDIKETIGKTIISITDEISVMNGTLIVITFSDGSYYLNYKED